MRRAWGVVRRVVLRGSRRPSPRRTKGRATTRPTSPSPPRGPHRKLAELRAQAPTRRLDRAVLILEWVEVGRVPPAPPLKYHQGLIRTRLVTDLLLKKSIDRNRHILSLAYLAYFPSHQTAVPITFINPRLCHRQNFTFLS